MTYVLGGQTCGSRPFPQLGAVPAARSVAAALRFQGVERPWAPGRAEPDDHVLGRSRGGRSTKDHLASDGHARPLALRVTAETQATKIPGTIQGAKM